MEEHIPQQQQEHEELPPPERNLRRKIHSKLEGKPIALILNVTVIVLAILCDIAVITGLITISTRLLHWIVAIYLFLGSFLLIAASLPVKFRQKALRYFLFLSTYNGKSAFMILMALLMFGLGTFAIIVGVFYFVVAIVHILLWLFFREIVTESKGQLASLEEEGLPSEEGGFPYPEADYTYSGALGGAQGAPGTVKTAGGAATQDTGLPPSSPTGGSGKVMQGMGGSPTSSTGGTPQGGLANTGGMMQTTSTYGAAGLGSVPLNTGGGAPPKYDSSDDEDSDSDDSQRVG